MKMKWFEARTPSFWQYPAAKNLISSTPLVGNIGNHRTNFKKTVFFPLHLSVLRYNRSMKHKEHITKQDVETKDIELGLIKHRKGNDRCEADHNAIERLAADMKIDGYDENWPIIAEERDDGYMIIDGRHRYEAAKLAGVEEVPVIAFLSSRSKWMDAAKQNFMGTMDKIREAAGYAIDTGYEGVPQNIINQMID